MKKILFLLFLVIFSGTCCRGQSAVSPLLSLEKQLTLKRVTARTFIVPAVGFRHGKNMILAGPVIRLAQWDNAQRDKTELTGIRYTQAYFFTGEEKKLQLCLVFQSKYQQTEEEWESNYWNAARNQYINYELESEETIWENGLGPGLVWKFHPNFSLNSSLCLGYYLSFLENEKPDESFSTASAKDYRGYRDQGLYYSFQVGIVYRFADVSQFLEKF